MMHGYNRSDLHGAKHSEILYRLKDNNYKNNTH